MLELSYSGSGKITLNKLNDQVRNAFHDEFRKVGSITLGILARRVSREPEIQEKRKKLRNLLLFGKWKNRG